MNDATINSASDPFEGLCLPLGAWKALEAARIKNLEELKTVIVSQKKIPGIAPRTALVIKDRLKRLDGRRTLHVRLTFAKRHGTKPPLDMSSKRAMVSRE